MLCNLVASASGFSTSRRACCCQFCCFFLLLMLGDCSFIRDSIFYVWFYQFFYQFFPIIIVNNTFNNIFRFFLLLLCVIICNWSTFVSTGWLFGYLCIRFGLFFFFGAPYNGVYKFSAVFYPGVELWKQKFFLFADRSWRVRPFPPAVWWSAETTWTAQLRQASAFKFNYLFLVC